MKEKTNNTKKAIISICSIFGILLAAFFIYTAILFDNMAEKGEKEATINAAKVLATKKTAHQKEQPKPLTSIKEGKREKKERQKKKTEEPLLAKAPLTPDQQMLVEIGFKPKGGHSVSVNN